MQNPELTQEQSDRLAEALIGEVVAGALVKQQAAVQHRGRNPSRAR